MSQTIQIERDDNTLEHEAWNIQLIRLNQGETASKGAATYSPIPNYKPQDAATTSTNNILPFSENNVTITPFATVVPQLGDFSNVPCGSTSSWFLFNNFESPPLTEEELSDIYRSLEEIKMGKTKKFNNVRDAIEWLHSNRSK
jgi:hypothetical protein